MAARMRGIGLCPEGACASVDVIMDCGQAHINMTSRAQVCQGPPSITVGLVPTHAQNYVFYVSKAFLATVTGMRRAGESSSIATMVLNLTLGGVEFCNQSISLPPEPLPASNEDDQEDVKGNNGAEETEETGDDNASDNSDHVMITPPPSGDQEVDRCIMNRSS